MPQQVEVKRTVVSMRDYARAVIKAWRTLYGNLPDKKSVAVLYAQYMIETGGKACWNWNIGNVKHVNGDGLDWVALNGVWEGVAPFVAASLIARGEATMDPSEMHQKAVGKNRTSVIFKAGHPATLFRAYPNLDTAMTSHLKFLHSRFAPCWSDVIEGDYAGFAHSLKAGRDGKENTADDYFTASAEAYASGMSGHFFNFVNSPMFDAELQTFLSDMNTPTLPALSTDVPEDEPMAIIHPAVPLEREDPPMCSRCGRVNPSKDEDCPLGAEMPDGGTEPHLFT